MTDDERFIAEIDLDAIAFNIQNIRNKVPQDTMVMGVVKADAYGHGAVEVSNTLLENGVDWLAIAAVDEAVRLRRNGVVTPILILGATPPGRLKDIVKYEVAQTIFSVKDAALLQKVAEEAGKKAKIHVKIDTGMGRLGFLPCKESVEEIAAIAEMKNIELNGLFTHFAKSDTFDQSFTVLQAERFSGMAEALKKRGISIPILHCANSAAIMEYGGLHFNMVRPGIVMYGLYPSHEVQRELLPLKPAMRLISRIGFIKTLPAGVPVGYGCTYITDRESVIATIPAGYGDGYLRGMQKGGRVLICGKYAPIIGRICMDQFMADVTDIPEAYEGAEVVLMGKQGGAEITAEEIAGILGTISYEVVCLISRRVPRIYLRNGQIVKKVNYLVDE